MNEQKPEVNIGFGFLSFFFPIVGLILFFVWKSQKEKAMTRCLVPAIVGFVISLIANFAILVPMMNAASNLTY